MALSKVHLPKGFQSVALSHYEGAPIALIQTSKKAGVEVETQKSSFKTAARGTLDESFDGATYTFSCDGVELPKALQEAFFNVEATEYDTTTGIVDIHNIGDGTAYDSSSGIASISIEDEDEIKPGAYRVVVKTASTLSLYSLSDASFKEGTDAAYLDDSLLIEDDIAITTDTTTGITGFGIGFVGGEGTIGMTIGNVFDFVVTGGGTGWRVGAGVPGYEPVAASAVIMTPKKNGKYNIVKVHKFYLYPQSRKFADGEYATWEIKSECIMDTAQGTGGEVYAEFELTMP